MARRWSFFASPMEHRGLRALDDLYRGLLTPGGRVLAWGVLTSAVLLLGGLVEPLLVAFGFCTAGLLCALALGVPFRPRVKLQRHLPPFPSAGDVFRYQVSVENTGRRTARLVAVEERDLPAELRPVGEPPQVDELGPGQRATVTLQLACQQRGAYTLGALQASSSFPTGIFKWPVRAPSADRLLVYPKFTPVTNFTVPTGRNYQPGGFAVASEVGDSSEFFGTREWREGDRLRDIHWPSLARTGRLIVKEFQQEYFIRLAMVLDVEARTARQEAALEKSLSLAAGIADALAHREYIIDLFAAGPEIFHFQAGRALAHFENILEILACLEGGSRLNMEALESALVPEAPKLSAVIFVTMDWEERRARLVRTLRELGVAVRVLSIRVRQRPVDVLEEEWVVIP